MLGVQVKSLVGELRFDMSCCTVKKKKFFFKYMYIHVYTFGFQMSVLQCKRGIKYQRSFI